MHLDYGREFFLQHIMNLFVIMDKTIIIAVQ